MKIGIVVPFSWSYWGGVVEHAEHQAAALPEAPVCEGTFYVWIKLPEGVTAETLLEQYRVVVAPGEGFGPSGTGWARISLAVGDEQIELGAERLGRAFAAVAGAAR